MPIGIYWVDEQGIERPFSDLLHNDETSESLAVITHSHHEIHEGHSYAAHLDITTANTDEHRSAIGFRTSTRYPDT